MQVSKSALLPYSDQQLFDLINDIESYPSFLDGCDDAEILRCEGDVMEARLALSKKGVSQVFVTRNTLVPGRSITMELVEGPLQSLNGEWRISPLADQGCKLSLELSFEMKQGLVMQMIAKFFGEIGNRLVDAVSDEADRRYANNQ